MSVYFQKWMLPEGVVESLPAEAEIIDYLESQAIASFASWGFRRVRPPVMEYLDSLINDQSKTDDLLEQTIQFKDQVSGKQLGIRADITPQVARIDSYYLKTDKVSRYAYSGEVVRSYPVGYGDYRNPTLAGVELFGANCVEADAEVVSLLIYYLKQIKVDHFIIDLGSISIAKALFKYFSLDESRAKYYFDALENKDREALIKLSEVDELLESQVKQLLQLIDLNGDVSLLLQAKIIYRDYPDVIEHIDALAHVVDYLLNIVGFDQIHIDLGDVRGYGYHNGLIFSAYKADDWKALAQGGRYEQSCQEDGRVTIRAGVGFSCNLHVLAKYTHLVRKDQRIILCRLEQNKVLNQLIEEYRKDSVVVMSFDKHQVFEQCTHELILDQTGQYQLVELNISSR